MSMTNLNAFGSNIRGAKNIPEMRVALAEASHKVQYFGQGEEKKKEILSLIEAAESEIIKDALLGHLKTVVADDDSIRVAAHAAACKIAGGAANALKALCEPSYISTMNKAQLDRFISTMRHIVEMSEGIVPQNETK